MRLQYYCSNCSTVLKEADQELDVAVREPCPECGSMLSQSLLKIPVRRPAKLVSVFRKASSLPKLTLDITKLDSILHFFTLNQKVCIVGPHSQKLIERLCVRAQLPNRYGGLGAKVLLIDGANSSDLYLCVDFAQQYGLDVKKVLNGIISSRAFTVYQLANLIAFELENAIKRFDVKLVMITNILHYFTNEPYLDPKEMERILREIIKSLEKIEDCLVIVSLAFPTKFDGIVQNLFSTTIKIESESNGLSVIVNTGSKHSLVILPEDALEKTQQ